MKTKDAIELAGSAAALSRILNITQSAICQWGDDIPELSLFRLKERKPAWFKSQPRKARTEKAEA
ncbi:MAG: Cro/Cl family transcriptional regulator [Rhodoferax sp.]|uniref:Cro/CI family transcriptional regulator n=1 Tax=Rhodoferax sp. TaxID=50421 RepID=UPI00184FCD17|nr:Cro/CI family transcriptional regulator [Rhodoferax sp.]NMM21559.1 Cro/Cl family transcriptional regulator [Rhodoferax sp.]